MGGKLEIYRQKVIALNGKKVFGRFDFNLDDNTLIDHESDWYMNKDKWNYVTAPDGSNYGIQIFSIMSTTYGGVSTFIESQTIITSQYLKSKAWNTNISYSWAEQLFKSDTVMKHLNL